MARSRTSVLAALLLVVVVLASSCSANVKTVRLATPPMGWSTWESFGKDISEAKIMANVAILKSSGLWAKGYNIIQIDDGWMKTNRTSAWVSRVNYDERPQNRNGPNRLPAFYPKIPPGCMIADPIKFPTGMAQLGTDIKALGFKFGLYTSGEIYGCDATPGFRAIYASPSNYNLRNIDAACFVSWGIDLIKVDMCQPPTVRTQYAQSVISAWRRILPNNIILYNSRYGCLAQTSCSGASSIYRCPTRVNPKKNKKIPGYCLATSDIARLGPDMKPKWSSIIVGITSVMGRGKVSRPGFWSDPDYLIPHSSLVSFNESRTQFSVWCITSAPLLISVDLRLSSPQTLKMLGNSDAIRVNQVYFDSAGDVIATMGVIWTFMKRLSATETAFLVMHSDKPYARGSGVKSAAPVSYNFGNLRPFFKGQKPVSCIARNIWEQHDFVIKPFDTVVVSPRDCVFIIVSNCTAI